MTYVILTIYSDIKLSSYHNIHILSYFFWHLTTNLEQGKKVFWVESHNLFCHQMCLLIAQVNIKQVYYDQIYSLNVPHYKSIILNYSGNWFFQHWGQNGCLIKRFQVNFLQTPCLQLDVFLIMVKMFNCIDWLIMYF